MKCDFVSFARRRPRRRAATLLCLAGLGAAACSINPLTQRPQVVLASKKTEGEIGRKGSEQVEIGIGLVADEKVTTYVEAIGQRLIAQVPDSGFAFQFNVVNMPEPNAFALPGGPIYVSRGLLPLVNSEDELANVIGHEVAHVLGRDAASRGTLSAPLSIITGIGALATGIVSPALGGVVAGLGGATQSLLFSPYSRSQENAADRHGMELAAKCGWQPTAMSNFLQTLENQEKLEGEEERRFAFFSSHPTTPDRVKKTAARAAAIAVVPGEPIEPDRRRFLDRFDGMIVDQDPDEGIFVDNRMLHTGLGFVLDFPEGWKTENRPRVIAAADPNGRAVCVLELASAGDDPLAVAREMAPRYGLNDNNLHSIEINGLSAVSATGRSRQVRAELTWVAHRGDVYLITCATEPEREAQYRSAFIKVPHSFHALRDDERAAIRVRRLRVVEAKSGETLAALCARESCAWSLEEVATANALETDPTLAAGALVKIARDEPYVTP